MPGLVSFDTNFEKMRRNKNANSAEKKASEQTQTDDKILLSLFEINIIRYSLFIDNIKPEQIDPFFMIDFMSLPEDYFLEENIQKYIETHPGINKDMHLLVRHLQPTEKGIPLEIYCFSKDKKWENYEYIMADIFDHIIASVPYFDLELFEVQHVKAEKLNLLDID